MASCEQLAGELKVLEELLKQYSTEHKRQEIIDRIDQIKTEQQERGCLEKGKAQEGAMKLSGRELVKEEPTRHHRPMSFQ